VRLFCCTVTNVEFPRAEHSPRLLNVEFLRADNLPRLLNVEFPRADHLPRLLNVEFLRADHLPRLLNVEFLRADLLPRLLNVEFPRADHLPRLLNVEFPRADHLPRLRNVEFPRAEHLQCGCICPFQIYLCVLFFSCARIVYSLSLPKCKPIVVGVLIFVFLIIPRTHVRLNTLCVTASLCLLAQGIILFPISCMYLELCAHNIFVSHLLSQCPGHVFCVFLSLTPSHKKSSLQGSVAQTADGNKQGAESPGRPYQLVRLINMLALLTLCNCMYTYLLHGVESFLKC